MRRLLAAGLVAAALTAGCGSSSPPQQPPQQHASDLQQPAGPVRPPRVIPTRTQTKDGGLVVSGGASCGRERWNVKTATDPAAGNIITTPQPATVADLAALQSTNSGPDSPRDSGAELRTYTVHATLTAFKQEADSDVHLALTASGGATMIAELTDAPACTVPGVTARVSVLEREMESARADFTRMFGQATGSYQDVGRPVTITGVGFFDKIHGQRGVAPNGVELHPVTAISSP